MLHHLALGIEYVGTRFCGTQIQREQRTVQQELERAISQVAAEQVRIELSSRTDSGVHATNLVIGFESKAYRDNYNWQNGINSALPEDIAVHTVVPVSPSFDVRRSSRWRRYLYVFGECDHIPAIGRNLASWVAPGLKVADMDTQAQSLLGEQDFSSFRAVNCQSKSPRRRVHAVSVFRTDCYVVIDIIANAYVLRMVRNISGALLDIGRGSGLEVSTLLSYQDRSQAPPTAPAAGLYLVQICYQDASDLSMLRVPRILGAGTKLTRWGIDDFVNVRDMIEPHKTLVE